jgi:nucleoside phosphorylase
MRMDQSERRRGASSRVVERRGLTPLYSEDVSVDVCIVCALPEEARAVLAVLRTRSAGAIEERSSPRYGYSSRLATITNDQGEPLTLHLSWLPRYGPQEMTLHLSRVLEEYQPRLAVMTGICAGDATRVQLGDLVVAERTFTYDSGKYTLDEQGRRVHEHDTLTYQLDATILQFLGLFDAWRPQLARLRRPPFPPELHKSKIVCHIKPMASGSAVRADHPFAEVRVPVRGTVAIDMEGAAFGLVMSRHPTIPWLIVKGVSDYADRAKNDDYHGYAARASALYALSFLRAYLTSERQPPFPEQGRRTLPQGGSHPQPMIERLRRHTRHTLDLLSPTAAIRAGTARVKIPRRCATAIRAAAEDGPLVVTGPPGNGKSVALSDVVEMLLAEGRDVVFLTTEEADSAQLSVQDVVDALEQWAGEAPAFLVIDALDSTRFGQSDRVLRTLLARVAAAGTRWRVIAAMRTFDLSYDVDIQQIFAGVPPDRAFQEGTLAHLRHLAIPALTEEELNYAGTHAPLLARLLSEAPPQLRELLTNPFNLRLAGELLQEGVGRQELMPLRTQVQLLDRYWAHYVTRPDGFRDAREFVLRHACEEMLAARAPRVERAQLSDPAASQALGHLLHAHLLIAWQEDDGALPDDSLLAFSHRILFDYAVARLLLSSANQLVRRLEQGRELSIVIRPSIVYRFQQFWLQSNEAGRAHFWRVVLRVQRGQNIPTVGKLIGPSVAAAFATELAALEPLLAALADGRDEERDAGEAALRHLIGALVAEQGHLVGENAGPWCALLERTSRSTRLPVLLSTRVLLSQVVEQPERLTGEQRHLSGQAARRLLALAWESPGWASVLRRFLLQAVCRTYESDPAASRALVRRALSHEHLAAHGDQELLALGEEIPYLSARDPELVADFYAAAFSYEETSEAKTRIGGGQLLTLLSTRRQDYDTALYRLAQHYPAFLREAPLVAVRALIAVLDGQYPPPQEEISSFDFLGASTSLRVRLDLWPLSRDIREQPEPVGQMLSAFSIYLAQLAADPQRKEELQALLSLIGKANRHGVLWRRVLLEGAHAPATLGQALRQLTWAIPVVSSPELTEAIGDLLASLFADLDSAERERAERAILAIPGVFPEGRRSTGAYIRDQLVRRLPFEALVTEEAKTLAGALAPTGDDPEWLFSGAARWTGEDADSANEPFGEAQRAAHLFVQAHRQSEPTLVQCEAALPHLRALSSQLEALAPEERNGSGQALSAWRDIASACERIAGSNTVTCESDLGAFVRDTLLLAAAHPWPTGLAEEEEAFDESPVCGGDPRECAATGLTWLSLRQGCPTPVVLEAVGRLSTDPVASVRYLVAFHVRNLYRSAPDVMWRVLEDRARNETSNGVLRGVLGSLRGLLPAGESDRAAHLAEVIYERAPTGAGAVEVRKGCSLLFALLYLYRNHAPSRERLFALIGQPERAGDEVWQVLAAARETLTYGPIDSPLEEHEAVRRRGWDVMLRTVASIREALERAESTGEEGGQEQRLALYRLANAIGSDLYHASGAADATLHPEKDRSLAEKRRFLSEAELLLEALSTFGVPPLGHSLAQTLAFLVPANPARVFLLFARVILRVADRGYSYEPSGVNLLVSVVERYLAEYREVLQQDAAALGLIIQVLDHFVEAGWPAAWRLAYRLDQIFF